MLRRRAGHAWEIPVLIAVVFPLRAAMDFLTIYGLAWVGRSVIRDLRNELFAHYLSLPTRFFDQGSSGALISKITYNTEQVADAISNAVVIVHPRHARDRAFGRSDAEDEPAADAVGAGSRPRGAAS